MLEIQSLGEVAAKKFRETIQDKIWYLTRDCWLQNLHYVIPQLNDILAAGRALGVTEARNFTEEEIRELVKDVHTLRVLKMDKEAKGHLAKALTSVGVDDGVFDGVVA